LFIDPEDGDVRRCVEPTTVTRRLSSSPNTASMRVALATT